MPKSKISQRVQAEDRDLAAANAAILLADSAGKSVAEGEQDLAAIQAAQAVSMAEKKVEKSAAPAGKRQFILQEIRIDKFNVLRRRVLLTPSMCRKRGCGFDAAKEIGFDKGGWNDVPLDQVLPDGRTLEAAVLGVLKKHVDTVHVFEDSHIWDEDQLAQAKGWANLPPGLLGART